VTKEKEEPTKGDEAASTSIKNYFQCAEKKRTPEGRVRFPTINIAKKKLGPPYQNDGGGNGGRAEAQKGRGMTQRKQTSEISPDWQNTAIQTKKSKISPK